jgi:hypothetical protein
MAESACGRVGVWGVKPRIRKLIAFALAPNRGFLVDWTQKSVGYTENLRSK